LIRRPRFAPAWRGRRISPVSGAADRILIDKAAQRHAPVFERAEAGDLFAP
jgi:hypothetical protein